MVHEPVSPIEDSVPFLVSPLPIVPADKVESNSEPVNMRQLSNPLSCGLLIERQFVVLILLSVWRCVVGLEIL